jgi:small subunit ribosomal protein S20
MPRTKSAFKRHRQNEKIRERNRANKSALKKDLKSFEKDLRANPAEATKLVAQVSSALDRAARKNAIPKGRADRKKSRLALLARRVQKEASAAKS